MNCKLAAFALAILVALPLAARDADAPAPRADASYNFLAPGDAHGDEAPHHPGRGWFALHCPRGQCSIAPVTLVAVATHDPVVDEDSATDTGIYLSSPEMKDPMYYFRGSWLTARPVEQSFRGSLSFTYGSWLTMRLRQAEYHLYAEPRMAPDVAEPSKRDGRPLKGLHLMLRDNNHHNAQTLIAEDGSFDSIAIEWAGDLDGDGKLDMVIATSVSENQVTYTLWLSSQAKPGEYVGKAGYYTVTGC